MVFIAISKYVYWKYKLLLNSAKQVLGRYLRQILEPLGIKTLSKPARYRLDDKLAKYLPDNGIFIEVGATDGYTESNTYYLEKFRGWKGLLIEPIPALYKRCIKERPNLKVFNCALVANDYRYKTVVMKMGYLMSTVKGALKEAEAEHLKRARYFHGTNAKEIKVPARTLNSVLEEADVSHIDFLSLDVEGYELSVLRGLDFNKYKPVFMLIECLTESNRKEIEKYILKMYNFVAKLTKKDFLYRHKYG